MRLKDYNIKLHLIRHGQYDVTKVGGWTDDSLSIKGKEEVKNLLNKLDNDYDLFVSSDLVRAKETSEILNEKLKMNIDFNKGFREIDMGVLNTTTLKEFSEKYKDLDFSKMKPDEKFPGGESQNEFFERVNKASLELLENNKNKKILLVTHGGVLSVILYLLKVENDEDGNPIRLETGSITKLS